MQEKGSESVTETVSSEAEGMGTENEAVIPEKSEDKPNLTGLPDELKAGVENLSGYSLDEVRVHYNSPKPAQLDALAYTQGTEIHVAPGQLKHLPHEAWHVVQQMQGRVKPTVQMKGVQINDDEGLEREADMMGAKALQIGHHEQVTSQQFAPIQMANNSTSLTHNPTTGLKDRESAMSAFMFRSVTLARAELVLPDGNVVSFQARQSGSSAHAEDILLEKVKEYIRGEKLNPGECVLRITINNLPCGEKEKDCATTLGNFAIGAGFKRIHLYSGFPLGEVQLLACQPR